MPGAPDWLEPLAAVTLAAGRQPRRRRGGCGSRCSRGADDDWLRRTARAAAAAARRARSDRRAARGWPSTTSGALQVPPRSWARADRAPATCAACRATRPATPYLLDGARGVDHARAAARRSIRCRWSRCRSSRCRRVDRRRVRHRRAGARRPVSSAASSTSASTGCRGASRWCGRRRTAPPCDRALSWYENVPVVGWLVLRGRCRTCRAPISRRCTRSSRS